ncbi:MAG TPA: hypothetical protein PKC84_11110, partial [Paracoccaceae bacterium]|nr:hypothetical protein [Paracoccaceae bacterium]
MLVFWDQRLAFLATPKTGSTAIAAALEPLAALSVQRPPVLKHTTVHRWHRFLGPYLSAASGGDGFTLVALMREPESWLGSWFRYRQRDDGVDPSKSTRGIGFDQFVRDWCTEPQPPHAAVGSQERFLRPRHGTAGWQSARLAAWLGASARAILLNGERSRA